MFSKINEKIGQNTFTVYGQNIHNNCFSSNGKETEKQGKGNISKISFEANLINNINEREKNYEININSKEKKKIFKVNYRNYHKGDDSDNLKQMVVRGFLSLFIGFINYIIKEKIKEEEKKNKRLLKTELLEFKIGYQLKSKIKFEDINELKVEQLLSFESYNNINNEKKDKEKIKEIRNIFGSSLDKLFQTQVLDLFKEIYHRKIQNESDKDVDLKKYGIEGITFKITDNIPTYQTLKDKYISNTFKINKMDEIIESNIIKPKLFKIKKQK